MPDISGWKDDILFTPGPLTTSQTVKQALLRDFGSRDFAFIEKVKAIRAMLLQAAGVGEDYTCIPLQGSGTFSVEAVFSATVPADGKVLIVVNGAYGERMLTICDYLKIPAIAVRCPENEAPDPAAVAKALEGNPGISLVATVHCETTTGIFNPLEEIGALAKKAGASYFVDAMSSFGAVPIDFAAANIDYLVSSANKCIEGVPGFGFVIARLAALEATEGNARSLSFDLLSQYRGLEKNGQFRFTPPTHSLVAYHQALLELEQEGGVEGRAARYRNNYETLVTGMRALGFREYLRPDQQGYIITSFLYPDDPNWSFEKFYTLLNDRGYVIYPGKVSNADCFRIGNIGRIFKNDVQDLLAAIRAVIEEMNLNLQ
jgi:2-aminoethylphosphonate-pyruvate transaminase